MDSDQAAKIVTLWDVPDVEDLPTSECRVQGTAGTACTSEHRAQQLRVKGTAAHVHAAFARTSQPAACRY